MRRRLALGAGLLATALLAATSAPLGAQAAKVEAQQIATAEANDFRAVVTATRGASDGGVPMATATIEGFVRSGDSWKSAGKLPIGDEPWFWYVLTDIGAVCDLSVADTPRAAVTVALLTTQSTDCAGVATFHVDDGKLVAG